MKRLAAAACGLLTLAAVAAEPVPLFDGSDSYVDLGTPDALQIPSNEPFTVEGWMLFHGVKTLDMLYCKNNGRAGPYTYMLGFYNGKMTAYNTAWCGNFAVSRQSDHWYHVAFSFDGVDMAFYLDGALLGTAAFSFNNNAAHTVKIGGYNTSSDINGHVSDVRVWDHARTQSEIQGAMSNRLTGADSGLLGYWPLNEGSGTNVYDLTTAASDGILIGASWTNNAALSEHITGAADFAYARAFTIANLETGSREFTNSNEVEVVTFPVPDGCNAWQVGQTGEVAEIDPNGWESTNMLPPTLSFSLPSDDTNVFLYAWFTNTADTVTVARAVGWIRYSETLPIPVARATQSRLLIPGQLVVLHAAEIDAGSNGGETGGESIPLHAMSLNWLSGPDTNATPEAPFVTVSALGSYEVELVVMNAAGNIATSSVCQVEVTAYDGETFEWTGVINEDWHNPLNWNLHAIPVAGSEAVIGQDAAVCLSAPTAELAALTMTGGTLTFSNWTTRLAAETVTLGGGTVTCVGAFLNGAMSNRVWLTGNTLTVGSNATIDVDGGGYQGGNTSVAYIGQGPGGGAKGGGYGSGGANGGFGGVFGESLSLPYGSAADPVYPGSGGGANGGVIQQGGHGGGAIRLDFSAAVTLDGTLTANGLTSYTHASGGGSGGSILLACDTLSGSGGAIRAVGGDTQTYGGGGGGGRLAIRYNAAAQTVAPEIAISAAPGRCPSGVFQAQGGVGSVWLPNPLFLSQTLTSDTFVGAVYGFNAWSPDSLTISDTIVQFPEEGFQLQVAGSVLVSGSFARLALGGRNVRNNGSRLPLFFNSETGVLFSAAELVLTNGASMFVYSGPTNGMPGAAGACVDVQNDLVIHANSWLFPAAHPHNGGAPLLRMRNLVIAHPDSGIKADGLGFQGGVPPSHRNGFGPGGGAGVSSGRAAGGGHGGRGGGSTWVATRAPTHGSEEAPLDPGSGGGGQSAIGDTGGGVVRVAAERAVTLNGRISADGFDAASAVLGAGAGGSVFIQCSRLSGSGAIEAKGGDGASAGSGAGGGGRIALWYHRTTDAFALDVDGGAGAAELNAGEDGTCFRRVLPAPGTILLLR